MKRLFSKVTIPIFFIFALFGSDANAVLNTFYRVNPDSTVNIKGNYAVAGNTVMCLTERTSGYGGTCQDGNNYLTITSNMHVSKYLDIDGDSNTWNSTSSYINLPVSYDASDLTNAKKGIVWAGLFWQGRISADKDYAMHYGVEDNGGGYHFVEIGNGSANSLPNDLTTIGANRIKLKVDSGTYADITANTFYTYSSSNGTTYAAYADVTNIVRPFITASGKHVFTVANLTTNEGREGTPGVFGGWSLVVIYAEDYRGDMRNISVYNGFDIVSNPSQAFTITNFILPKQNNVNASLSLFSGEGEYLYGHWSGNPNAYDWVKISPDGTNYDYMPVPSNLDNRNIFDGRFSGVLRDNIAGAYNDLTNNNDGVDVDTYDVSNIMTQYRDANPNLNKLYIQWASNNDYITPSMLVFATQIYEPKFCYDYAYKQYGRYFTEENDGTHYPRLVGKVFQNEPVDVKIYLRNQIASDLTIENMRLNVVDINTSQAKYDVNTDSVKIAKVGELTPHTITNNLLNVADNYIKDIPVGDMGANDYVYLYYSLKPVSTNLDMPIGIEASYNLVLSTDVNVSYDLRLGPDIPMCSDANFNYAPAKGIFNLVHSDYYDADVGGPNSYYNLPTQVVGRVGSFKVLSFDPQHLDQLQDINDSVTTFVEMIDASVFHDVNASCQELSSAITDKVEVDFDHSASEPFNSSTGVTSNFYGTARENAAFRISYNTDPNGNLLDWKTDDNVTYYLTNFPQISQLGACKESGLQFVDKHGNLHTNVNTAADACGNAGVGNGSASISKSQRSACERCVYGYYTRVVCSRDNFAIRPEAFLIKLNDQNQTTGSSEVRIADNISGNSTPVSAIVDLAAGYNYDIEINATSFNGNNAVPGYTSFYNDITSNQYIMFKWEPQTTVINCNDTNDTKLSVNLYDGKLLNLHDQNASVGNVGDYRLTMFDSQWTRVDWNPAYMSHHQGSYFLPSNVADCVAGSDVVPAGSMGAPTPAVGCNITSDHNASVSGIKYRDYLVTFHPYQFDLSTITSSTGVNDANATTNNFVYDANISDNTSGTYTDLNMSYHIYGAIEAQGANGDALTNFVSGCFAKDVGITLSRTAYADTTMTFKQSLETLDQNGSRIAINFEDANNSKFLVFVPKSSFTQQLNGKANVRVRYNFTRDINDSKNPQKIVFSTLNVDCNNMGECSSAANFSGSFTPHSAKNINDTIYFYYARAHVPKMVTNGADGNATGYYEVYCYGSGCNKNYLQAELAGGTSANSDDPRWWINGSHTSNFGKINSVTQKRTPAHVSVTTAPTGSAADTIGLHYDGTKGYPYRAIMKIVPDKWLIYNKYDPNADHNEFEAQFNNDTSDWIGSGETQDATETKKFGYKDRKLTW